MFQASSEYNQILLEKLLDQQFYQDLGMKILQVLNARWFTAIFLLPRAQVEHFREGWRWDSPP